MTGQEEHCSVGTCPRNTALAGDIARGDVTRGCGRSKLGLASPRGFYLWSYSLSVQKGIPWEPFYCSHLFMTLM